MPKSSVFELNQRDRKRLALKLSASNAKPLAVRTADGEIELPAVARRAVELLLADLAAGVPVHVLAVERDLSTQETAELLGLSRTFVVELIDAGKIPAHFAGTHRRVRASDAIEYLQRRSDRLVAVAAIAEADLAAGIPYR